MKKRQRIVLKSTTGERATSQPKRTNSTPPPQKQGDEYEIDEHPWGIIGAIIAIGVLVNMMLWCGIFIWGG